MKKVLVFVVVLCMLVAFSACAEESDASESTGTSTSEASEDTEAAEEQIIGFIQKDTETAFHAILNAAAIEALEELKSDGVIDDYLCIDGQDDPVTQVNATEELINMGATCIMIAPAEADGSAAVLTRADEEGIPVVVVNSKTNNTDELAAAYVGSDDIFAGHMLAEFIQEKIPEGGGYAHLEGIIGNSAQIDRTEGLHQIMDEDTSWTLLAEQSANYSGEEAIVFVQDWIALYGEELNAIVCDNDDMSTAAKGVCNQMDRSDIVCIGIDGTATAFSMVKSGELDGSIYQDGAGQATKAVELCGDIIQGNEVEQTYMIDFILVTQDNIDEYYEG